MRKKAIKRILSMILSLVLVITLLQVMPINQSVLAAGESLNNPEIIENPAMDSGQCVTWDCIYMGSYPQTEIVGQASQSGVYGKWFENEGDYVIDASLYNKLTKSSSWDSHNNITIDGVKYKRLQRGDATNSSFTESYYSWSNDIKYHYFKYEPIKWRVLNVNGTEALLLSDIALDDIKYNESYTDVTWETCTVRSWLNGYSYNVNNEGINYTDNNFIDTAFSSVEKSAIKNSNIVNDTNTYYSGLGSNSTRDKIFFLSESQVYTDTAKAYGFVNRYTAYDEARQCSSTTYAKAMGAWSSKYSGYAGNCAWWLRSPGNSFKKAITINPGGSGEYDGQEVHYNDNAIRPAMIIDLSSNVWSYAGKVSSDGIVCELPKIKKQPKSKVYISAYYDSTVTLAVEAENATSYQWYYYDEDGWYVIKGNATSPTLEYKGIDFNGLTKVDYGRKIRCCIKNATGEVWSDVITLAECKSLTNDYNKNITVAPFYAGDKADLNGNSLVSSDTYSFYFDEECFDNVFSIYKCDASGKYIRDENNKIIELNDGDEFEAGYRYEIRMQIVMPEDVHAIDAYTLFDENNILVNGEPCEADSVNYYEEPYGATIFWMSPVVEAGKWIKSNGKWWYRHADGTYTKNGWEKIDGKWYHFDASGYMQTGWQKISNVWYYFNASGAMQTGWQKIGGKWYYFNGSGAMQKGWQKISGKWYYFEGSGAMLTGWQKLSNKWYYFNTSGAMLTGWQEINSKWYYFDASGVMQSACWVNKIYYMDSTGVMVTSAYIKDGSKYYWMDKNGKYTKTYSEKDTKGYTIYDQATGKIY